MFYPIGDENVQGGAFPILTYTFISLNVLIFFMEANFPPEVLDNFILMFGAVPNQIVSGENLHALLTCMFLHGGWMHLFGNMLFMWIFADNIEATLGSFRFLIFYVMAGIIAAFAHIFFNIDSSIPMVGASGAIAGVLGAYLVMYPQSQVKVLFILFFFRPFYWPAWVFLGIWGAQQIISGVGELTVTADTAGVAYWAHIGGFVFGVLAGIYFRSTRERAYAIG